MTGEPTNAPIERLTACGIVPVVVIDDPARAVDVATALLEGGIGCVEVTLRTPAGLDALAAMSAIPGLTVGAGTVLTPEQVDAAIDAGAEFIVSPGFDDDVVARAGERDITAIPGVATATEIQRALRAGLEAVKFFPAERLGGLAAIDALAEPFPLLRFLPSGGIREDNLVAYLRHPAVFAVGGSWMIRRQAIADGEVDAIRAATASAAALVRTAR